MITKALLKAGLVFKSRGFRIQVCHVDGGFEAIKGTMENRRNRFPINTTGPNEHVPEAERGIQTIKGRTRSTITTLPFRN